MGFDQRAHRRIPFGGYIHFWPEGGDLTGPGTWGEALNLSESGLSFTCEKSVIKGSRLEVEIKMPDRTGYLRLLSQLVHCEPMGPGGKIWNLRVRFLEPHREELVPMRRYILQTADPAMAAITGWGRVLVQDMPSVVAHYRDLSPDQSKRWTEDPNFMVTTEFAHLIRFQQVLEASLGNKTPGSIRLKGTLRIKEKAMAWVELTLIKGRLRLLGETIWSRQEPDEDAEAGLRVLAYSKEDVKHLNK
ncbi:MAG TPA: PilZ domain-containing protein [bacterium]|jgi:hypothetical protein|nr:PilZ domain-containing protein [bacterium]